MEFFNVTLSEDFQKQIKEMIVDAVREVILSDEGQESIRVKNEWVTLKDAAKYAGVSYGTLMKFRESGLEIAEVDGVKRVNKRAIDEFFSRNSY